MTCSGLPITGKMSNSHNKDLNLNSVIRTINVFWICQIGIVKMLAHKIYFHISEFMSLLNSFLVA